jgi:hypothetical protein
MAMLQQQQQQAGMCANPAAAAAAAAASGYMGGAAMAPGNLHHAMTTGHMDLNTIMQQQQLSGMPAGLQRAQSQPAPTAAAAAAVSSGGMDCSSAAESASDGQQQQQLQGAAVPQLVMPAGPGAAAAASMASPSTLTSAGQQLQQQVAAGARQSTPGAAMTAMTAESDAAAAAAAAVAAGVPVLPGPDEGGEQKLVCQVPGCGRDLQGLKEYHQRYRICDVHIKLPQVRLGQAAVWVLMQRVVDYLSSNSDDEVTVSCHRWGWVRLQYGQQCK